MALRFSYGSKQGKELSFETDPTRKYTQWRIQIRALLSLVAAVQGAMKPLADQRPEDSGARSEFVCDRYAAPRFCRMPSPTLARFMIPATRAVQGPAHARLPRL